MISRVRDAAAHDDAPREDIRAGADKGGHAKALRTVSKDGDWQHTTRRVADGLKATHGSVDYDFLNPAKGYKDANDTVRFAGSQKVLIYDGGSIGRKDPHSDDCRRWIAEAISKT